MDLGAPGSGINSTLPNNSYGSYSGTSMATPHVTGAAALYASVNAGATGSQVKNAILSSTIPTSSLANRCVTGGRLNVDGFAGGGAPPGNSAPTVSISSPSSGASFLAPADITISANASDGDGSVTQVELFANGQSIGFGSDSDGDGVWTFSWLDVVAGSYTLTAVATDDDQASTTSNGVGITVNNPSTGISLSATGYKVKGLQKADLSWSGATSTSVDVYRNGAKIATVSNSGSYTDHINNRGGGSYTYKVCEAGSGTCSNDSTVTF